MEIYNESINDLLAPGKGNLKIKDDPNVRFFDILNDFIAWSRCSYVEKVASVYF
jgi:hypothetical protein